MKYRAIETNDALKNRIIDETEREKKREKERIQK